MSETAAADSGSIEESRSDTWTDLALTLPIFVLYHLGVVFLPIRNAADPVTSELTALANESIAGYAALTFAIGLGFVLLLGALGKKKTFTAKRFVIIAAEGMAYAVVMRLVGGWALEALPLASVPTEVHSESFSSVVMSLGAGFYEELAFRVALFGGGAWIIRTMEGYGPTGLVLLGGWALLSAVAFSGWHHIGPMADEFDVRVFAYRAICGLVLTAIYAFRGFAPAVWTHAAYDLWAMLG